MLVGIIGPQSSIDILSLNKSDLPIEFLPLPYKKFTEAAQIVEKYEQSCDGLLFTGQTPYSYVSSLLHPTKPWEYLPRNTLSTMCALLKAGLVYGNIHNISLDGFNDTLLKTICEELRDVPSSIHFYNATFDITASDYSEQVVKHHISKFRQGDVDICLTGIQYVYKILQEQRIPSIKINPNFALAQQKLELLLLKHKIFHSEKNLPAIIAIQPVFQLDYNTYGQSEIQLTRIRSLLSETIYYYAQKLSAAVFPATDNCYYLSCKADTIDVETNHFTSMKELLQNNITSPLLDKLAIGIGIGTTSLTAKYAANRALQKSLSSTHSCCYVIDAQNHISGPLTTATSQKDKNSLNSNLDKISKHTTIGLPTLQKLEQVLQQYKVKNITPTELAFYCNMPLRSMNRLLQKLEDYGYVSLVGKAPQLGSGRPRRIIKIDLTYHN